MIAWLEGKVLERGKNSCLLVIESGIGYEVFLPEPLLACLPPTGERLSLYIAHVIREDNQELYGFNTWDERCVFQILLGISKIGARTALAILSVFRPDDLRQLVLDNDASALTRVPGIGKKTAQHVFLEMKDKLKTEHLQISSSDERPNSLGSVYRDALSGLIGLGYNEEEAGLVLRKILQDNPDFDVSSALRTALKALAKSNSLFS